MTNPEHDRAAFEAWYVGEYGVEPQASSRGYYDRIAQFRWQGWQAARSLPIVVTEPCTRCHCQERAQKMLGDPRIGVHFPLTDFSKCKTCGSQLTLRFWPRHSGPPGNGWGPCETCAALNTTTHTGEGWE